ncbi:MAG: GOLPH3/VPS74 family protein [Planctomycetota bacterium]|jgi:hypothetical protein
MSHPAEPLHLYQECLLLSFQDDKGTRDPYANLGFSLGGAMLADLLMLGRVSVEKVKKSSFLKLEDGSPTGDELLDDCLGKLESAKRRAQLGTWVQRFAALRDLKHRAAAGLCDLGILKQEVGSVMLIFKRRIYPELDGRVEKEIMERLRKAIFTQTREMDPRTVVLISLANATGLLRANFDKKKLKERKRRIEQICEGEFVGKAALEAVQAAEMAVVMAAIIPAMVSTTVISS